MNPRRTAPIPGSPEPSGQDCSTRPHGLVLDGGDAVGLIAGDCTVLYDTDQRREYRDRVTLVVKPDATIPIRDGELALGTWQSIFLLECDGPREREVIVTVTDGE